MLRDRLNQFGLDQDNSPLCDSHKNVNSKFESSPLLVVRI